MPPLESGDPFDDPFDNALTPEASHLSRGHALGRCHGRRQTTRSSRLTGIHHSYQKFVELGQFRAKAQLWDRQLREAEESLHREKGLAVREDLVEKAELEGSPSPRPPSEWRDGDVAREEVAEVMDGLEVQDTAKVPRRLFMEPHMNSRTLLRLRHHIDYLYALTHDAPDRYVLNTDENVAALDEVLKRARGKELVIARFMQDNGAFQGPTEGKDLDGRPHDALEPWNRRVRNWGDGGIEDFGLT